MNCNQLNEVFDLIDVANSKDTESTGPNDNLRPAALVYGERMSGALERFKKSPSDHLQIAARAQHIERWTCPRASYPEGRAGYLKWRADLKSFHARRAGELMQEAGYSQSDIDRVGALVRKKGLKRDPEAQVLEDVACLVFLEHYAEEFIAKHEDEKVVDILRKTIGKMSADGVEAAKKIGLEGRLADLLHRALDDI